MTELETFIEHMQFEEEIHNWMCIAHYFDGRIFFFAYIRKVKFNRMAELSPYIKKFSEEDEFYVAIHNKQKQIRRYRQKFSAMISKMINCNRDFVGVVNYNSDTVNWSYNLEEILQ